MSDTRQPEDSTVRYCRENVRQMEGYVPGEQPRDRQYIKLNTNENPYPPSPGVERACRAFAFNQLRLYPDPRAGGLRSRAARLFGLEPDCVLAGNGSDDLLTLGVRTFVDQGGALACFDPTYSLYPVLADIQGARTLRIPLDDKFNMPQDACRRAAPASLVFVTRPNAPTGKAFALDSMHAFCHGFEGIVWIDEAYADFADDQCVDFLRHHPNVVVSRTFSKSYSLAGIRLGLAFARPPLIRQMMKVKDSYNVGTLPQVLGEAALADQSHMQANVERIRATRERVRDELNALGFDVVPSAANFLFAAPPVDAAHLMQRLKEHGVLVRYFPGERTGRYLRITIGTDEEMDVLLQRLAELMPVLS